MLGETAGNGAHLRDDMETLYNGKFLKCMNIILMRSQIMGDKKPKPVISYDQTRLLVERRSCIQFNCWPKWSHGNS